MAYTKEELEDWVKGFKVSDDKKAKLLETLADPDLLPEIGQAIMRQSDYSRKMDALTSEKQEIESKQSEVLARETELQTWYDTNSPLYTKAVEDRDKLKADLAKMTTEYVNKMGSLPDLNGQQPPPKTEDKLAFDDSKYVSRDEYEKALKATVPALAQWTAQAMQIDRENFELTGKHADLDKVLAEVYKGKDARAAWEETHGIAAVRQQKQEEHIAAQIEAARKDERAKVLTEQALDPNARRDQATKGFFEALSERSGDEASALAAADQASRARAISQLEGFDPRS